MAEARIYEGNGYSVTITDPDNITHDECLKLARCGSNAWNGWRSVFPSRFVNEKLENIALFYNEDFSKNKIDFSDFQFGDYAGFANAIFGTGAKFDRAQFGEGASFRGAQFTGVALFRAAKFGAGANFQGAQFAYDASFHDVEFAERANFSGVQFGEKVFFDRACFGQDANFVGRSWLSLKGTYDEKAQDRKTWAEARNLNPSSFQRITFDHAVFSGDVDFSDRRFEGISNFSNTTFGAAPKFHECQWHQDTSFDGAKFPPDRQKAEGLEASARAYRTLKLVFSQQQAMRDEQRFFKLEMEEEASRETGWKKWLYRAYSLTSDYGFSVWRPLKILVLYPALACVLLYMFITALANPVLWHAPLVDHPRLLGQWLQFNLANMLPLPDSELIKELRSNLFGGNQVASVFALAIESAQKLLALIGYFLIGLALRNLFKMK